MNAKASRSEELLSALFGKNAAQQVFDEIRRELRYSLRCAVVIGLEEEYHIIRAEAMDSWLADPTRKQRFLFAANRLTTLEDVEWQLQRGK